MKQRGNYNINAMKEKGWEERKIRKRERERGFKSFKTRYHNHGMIIINNVIHSVYT
jgi:hypothetical protein